MAGLVERGWLRPLGEDGAGAGESVITAELEGEDNAAAAMLQFRYSAAVNVAYNRLPFSFRGILHKCIGEWFEELYNCNPQPQLLPRLALHWSKTAEYLSDSASTAPSGIARQLSRWLVVVHLVRLATRSAHPQGWRCGECDAGVHTDAGRPDGSSCQNWDTGTIQLQCGASGERSAHHIVRLPRAAYAHNVANRAAASASRSHSARTRQSSHVASVSHARRRRSWPQTVADRAAHRFDRHVLPPPRHTLAAQGR